jgi:hypothetical protein
MSFWFSILVMYWAVGALGWLGISGIPALVVGIVIARKFHNHNCVKIETQEGRVS